MKPLMKKIFFTFFLFILCLPLAYPSQKRFIVTKDKINVRVDSVVSSHSLGLLNRGDRVEALGEKFGWMRIRLPQRFSCYASSQFVEEIAKNKGKVTASRLNLRNEPSLEAYVIGQADYGDDLVIIKKAGEWYKAKGYPYTTGWVHRDFLQEEKLYLSSLIEKMMPKFSNPEMKKKKGLHQELVDKGKSVVPLLETYLPSMDKNASYSAISILTQIGQKNPELASHFLKKAASSSVKLASVYLDIAQGIIQPKASKIAYFHLAEEGKLLPKAIKKAVSLLTEKYIENANPEQAENNETAK